MYIYMYICIFIYTSHIRACVVINILNHAYMVTYIFQKLTLLFIIYYLLLLFTSSLIYNLLLLLFIIIY